MRLRDRDRKLERDQFANRATRKLIGALGGLLLALALVGCAKNDGVVRAQELGSGQWQLECASPLARCSQDADQRCGGRGYDLVEGFDQRRRFGHEAGESQVEVRSSRLVVVCRSEQGEPRLVPQASAAALPAAVSSNPPTSSHTLRCTPGTTQRCYGAAACGGGQSCLPDGSGFGPCDCGKVAAPSDAPAP